MRQRGFSVDDFRVLHPGGRLGPKLMRVRDVMHGEPELPLVQLDTCMDDVLLTVTAMRFGCAGVVGAAGELVGIVTDGDLRRNMRPEMLQRQAREIMTRTPKVIAASALAGEALALMGSQQVTVLFVFDADEGRSVDGCPVPVGIVHMHDCVRAGA